MKAPGKTFSEVNMFEGRGRMRKVLLFSEQTGMVQRGGVEI